MFYPQLSSEQFPCLEIYIMQSANPEEKEKKKKKRVIKISILKKKEISDIPIPQNYDKLLIQTVSSIEHMG